MLPWDIHREGDQLVGLDPDWIAVKLDTHPYYRRARGKYSLKSVDYMILHDDLGLYLIELKDYDDTSLTDDDKSSLQDALDQKVEDSMTLIHSVERFLLSKWYYSWLWRYPWLRWVIPHRSSLWLRAATMIRQDRYVALADVRHHG